MNLLYLIGIALIFHAPMINAEKSGTYWLHFSKWNDHDTTFALSASLLDDVSPCIKSIGTDSKGSIYVSFSGCSDQTDFPYPDTSKVTSTVGGKSAPFKVLFYLHANINFTATSLLDPVVSKPVTMKNVYIAFGYLDDGSAGYWFGNHHCGPMQYDSEKFYCLSEELNIVSFAQQTFDTLHVYAVQEAKDPLYMYWQIEGVPNSVDMEISILKPAQINLETLLGVSVFEGGGGLKFDLGYLDTSSSREVLNAFEIKDGKTIGITSLGEIGLPDKLVFSVYLKITFTLYTEVFCGKAVDDIWSGITDCRRCSFMAPLRAQGNYAIGWDGNKFWIGADEHQCTAHKNHLDCLGTKNVNADVMGYNNHTITLKGYTRTKGGCDLGSRSFTCGEREIRDWVCSCSVNSTNQWNCAG
mmetsp:Transcript_32239/g.51351  ORF Transcript_32239/g.51351 Transcript_32239/m.51351 type:complete len:412 (-) Transcript_32239:519-1754(-)|eukprot:CAMPEP_0203744778 /NCGR_PEP_ID=MMETSP0098-20131031/741_1 /ASSEMBLY_ACC=CAM_ASM_000208 /TAXON_ID=96639 /ORGANISM=" , Strain NY0313808BC1" /LENGTH=411 /DNA_ID=CAMNT_0050632395 /DNA_START=660 /DNA_END=1895 /DNA_ORIENTATION=-